MPLSNLELKVSYSHDSSDMVRDFYVPCMKESLVYQRAVGYFTSAGLSVAAQGIAHLLKNEGHIQLIASPCLTVDDIEAIDSGYKNKDQVLFGIASRTLSEIESSLVRERLSALAWLVSSGFLDVRLALRTDDEGRLKRGIFHEKMGVFSDEEDNHVAFSGSPNETAGGFIENYEAIDVFWSWEDSQGRVVNKLKRFKKLWENKTAGLEIIDFTEATSELLSAYKTEMPPEIDPVEKVFGGTSYKVKKEGPVLPQNIELRDYQEEAIANWFENKGRGTFKMATGTGKTITALAAASSLYKKIGLQGLIIICPYRHLVTQWANECKKFGVAPILAFKSKQAWDGSLTNALINNSQDENSFTCVITTNATFAKPGFQSKIKHFPKKTLLIADEAHNLGAGHLKTCLPPSVGLRLALSATPERWFDDEGTEELLGYFGSVLDPQITIKEAIQKKALVPYRYYPILVELTDEERDEYLTLSEQIAKAFLFNKDKSEENQALTMLLAKRSRLIASAKNKLTALRELMATRTENTHMLFYCGDGTVEDPVSDEDLRHVEAVTKILGHEFGIQVASYTAATSIDERHLLQGRLDSGELQGLVAIRCLDEGVDIPSVKSAVILASSRNPRQFIQRRGRVLRKSFGKEEAVIYDMIVVPPKAAVVNPSERTLFKNELTRFVEFADLALNSGEARRKVLELQKLFGLMDI